MLILFLYEKKFGPAGIRKQRPVSDIEATDIENRSNERTPLLSAART